MLGFTRPNKNQPLRQRLDWLIKELERRGPFDGLSAQERKDLAGR